MSKIAITATLVCAGIGASLLAQTGYGTRPEPASQPTAARPPATPAASADAVKYHALLNKYCVSCHNSRSAFPAEGPVNLEAAAGFDDLVGHAGTWERVLRKLSVRAMPPPGMPRPTEAEYAGFTGWLATSLDHAWDGKLTPGRFVVHRLNRAEYANAVRVRSSRRRHRRVRSAADRRRGVRL